MLRIYNIEKEGKAKRFCSEFLSTFSYLNLRGDLKNAVVERDYWRGY